MKINKMTSYGIRIIGRMHLQQGRIMTSKQLAETEGIPQGMVMKVLRSLKNAGIVESKQGRGEITGGFALHRDMKKTTIYHLIKAMEEDVCMYPDFERKRYQGDLAPLYQELKRIHQTYVEELKRLSIYNILEED